MKKFLAVISLITGSMNLLAVTHGVGFDRAAVGTYRNREKAFIALQDYVRVHCSEKYNSLNSQYHVELARNGMYAPTQDVISDCDSRFQSRR